MNASNNAPTAPPGGWHAPASKGAPNPYHEAKVCSVLLPIYAANADQRADVYLGYDKIAHNPAHGVLPRWKDNPTLVAKKEKYRG